MNYILFVAIFAVAIAVWQARWPQAPFDWIAMAASAYLAWSLSDRIELFAVVFLIAACIARAELHRNGVAMPRMWWRD